jgi:hypothetical protein
VTGEEKKTRPKTVRPELNADEIRMLLDGLDQLNMGARTMDEMDPITDLSARLAKAGQTVGYWRE